MQPLIKPSSDLRNNYNEVSQLCRTTREPVFLTRNGRGDTVIMDIDTYGRREQELFEAQRLIDAQTARLGGVEGYSLKEFREGMQIAIEQGSSRAHQNSDATGQ